MDEEKTCHQVSSIKRVSCYIGIGEACAKKVARQIGSALDWIHMKNLCHLDVRLDNILVFKSDFSVVKLCDFGSVRAQVTNHSWIFYLIQY